MPDTTGRLPIAPADFPRLKYVQSAGLSPDGKTVAYAVSRVDEAAQVERCAIWLLSIEIGVARQLTAGIASDTNPQWSPDGREVAFLSTRSGTQQLYAISVSGGEARPLTALPQGVGGAPLWSPDGRWIAFAAAQPEPRDPAKPYRVTRHIYRFDAMGYLDEAVQDVYVVAASGGEPRRLTQGGPHRAPQAWSPDSKELLVVESMYPDSHDLYYSLVAQSMDGAAREIVHRWGVYATCTAWTPDGKYIAFTGTSPDVPEGTKNDLWVVPSAGGTPECRTAGLLGHAGGTLLTHIPVTLGSLDLPAAADSRSVFVPVQTGGNVEIYRIALQGAEAWEPVVAGERTALPLGLRAERLLFVAGDFNLPSDLFLADLGNGSERRLTDLNGDLLAHRLQPAPVHLRFPSSDGVAVEGWLLTPPTGEPPYPTILAIHGGPYMAMGHVFHTDTQLLCGAGYAVLLINQRASTGYGTPFALRVKQDWGNMDYRDLMAGVGHCIDRGLADGDRLGVTGISFGGYMSCWIVGHTDRFKAAVPENPITNWVSMYGASDCGVDYALEELRGHPHEAPELYSRCSAITYAHRCRTPTLLIQGETDYRCPAEQAEQFYAALKASGCIVEMLRLPNSYHAGSINGPLASRAAHNEALLEWMDRYVRGRASPPAG